MSSTPTSIAFPALLGDLTESDILAFEEAMDINALLSDFSSPVVQKTTSLPSAADNQVYSDPIPPTFSISGIAGDERVSSEGASDVSTSSLGKDLVSSQVLPAPPPDLALWCPRLHHGMSCALRAICQRSLPRASGFGQPHQPVLGIGFCSLPPANSR
ncbi:hypothetical protein DXG03_005678 [Asterophora parasitica]|uniref:Uncharacterized protein n=1 Tax=Asterophora parasitica TaxID=117018 RepID=A0A9P7K9L3_9AGAR|nr:hypothetical protein DXG03_005678 [Asterophora parasitica]